MEYFFLSGHNGMKLDINKIMKTEKKMLYMWKFKNIQKTKKINKNIPKTKNHTV